MRCEGDLWVIDINDEEAKQLKTESSARLVPIHPQLIALKLVRLSGSLPSKEQDRLFPDEHRSTKGEFEAFSKRFARFRETCGVTGTRKIKKDFHSLRHKLPARALWPRGGEICGPGHHRAQQCW